MDTQLIKWHAVTDEVERNISPSMGRVVTIVPANMLTGLVIYVGVSAFNVDARISDNDLRALAQHIEYKLNT
jgi:hypothetical protein